MRLYCAYSRGVLEEARHEQQSINAVIERVRRYRLVPALRFMLSLRGIRTGESREPTLKLAALEESELASELESLGFWGR